MKVVLMTVAALACITVMPVVVYKLTAVSGDTARTTVSGDTSVSPAVTESVNNEGLNQQRGLLQRLVDSLHRDDDVRALHFPSNTNSRSPSPNSASVSTRAAGLHDQSSPSRIASVAPARHP
ncbi:uncharacterized protein LOC117649353 [Thrips palmi]|uniref:Uncharacterized protein LOC117649353 n=1 Tax=Thrips palmi TaxID=161013 RepID=A0A6P8ZRT8_THRPL|nr:uncharacterized protein LOC117649353 [Thrips palmi]